MKVELAKGRSGEEAKLSSGQEEDTAHWYLAEMSFTAKEEHASFVSSLVSSYRKCQKNPEYLQRYLLEDVKANKLIINPNKISSSFFFF